MALPICHVPFLYVKKQNRFPADGPLHAVYTLYFRKHDFLNVTNCDVMSYYCQH